jgi:hypothetical protein
VSLLCCEEEEEEEEDEGAETREKKKTLRCFLDFAFYSFVYAHFCCCKLSFNAYQN